MKTVLRFVASYVAMSLLLGAVALLSSFPQRPSTWQGWLALFTLIIPITFVVEAVGEVLHRNRVAGAVARHTEGRAFSWLRLAYLLVAGLVVAAAVLLLNQVAWWRT